MENSQVVNESALWNSVIAGEQPAFKALYEIYADTLFAYGNRYTTDRDLILDCIHDLFIDLHHYHHKLSRSVNIKFYLLAAMRRKLHLTLKKNARVKLIADASLFTLDFQSDSIQTAIIASEDEQRLIKLLAEQLNQLPARQKEIIYLKYHCDLSYEEIAAIMEIEIATCRTLAYRAIKQMRESMEGTTVKVFSTLLLILLAEI
ncbi:sigma-70 family RNA polymerase sigma factor [Chitinophaga sp. Cy-1792]|uniref:RNA polymerase sigma factor n=1 Tax=Chitinophaga sp. Cy-1792 TaxID=2608339 RepID=UPI00141F75F5